MTTECHDIPDLAADAFTPDPDWAAPPRQGAFPPSTAATPRRDIAGKAYMADPKGFLVPIEAIRPQDLLADELVGKLMLHARELSAQIARFKDHTFADIADFQALLAQEYDARAGGAKGNMTFTSFDGRMKVSVQVADRIEFGAELQIAKTLVDECLIDWSADSQPELRAVVTRAFQTDKEGKINQAALFSILRLEIADARWQRAMKAIRDSMRVTGTKSYVRFHVRAHGNAPWEAVSLDIASL
ncbi:MAG: DUF3164 family protein [Myxococcales bacterium]|nr:DUF3164 family protein [Myxococcales bacterium]